MRPEKLRILIQGAGEMASAIAHRLFQCGFFVVMTERDQPTMVRRKVAFGSAILDGKITVEGVEAHSYSLAQTALLSSFPLHHIPVFVDPKSQLIEIFHPQILIDGRLLKKNQTNSKDQAPLVIGLGPGMVAGRDVDYVVETNRGHHLGRIIEEGRAQENTSTPGNIGGYTWERILRAPTSGRFQSTKKIGDLVTAGDLLGHIGEHKITAVISGVLRGLVYPGSLVKINQKLGDIDPRGERAFCHTLSDKGRTLSGSVLEIIVSFFCKNIEFL